MIDIAKPTCRLKLCWMLLATTAVAVALALIPNHRVGELLFVLLENALLLALLIMLIVAILKKCMKRRD